jgi:hypothetical protein
MNLNLYHLWRAHVTGDMGGYLMDGVGGGEGQLEYHAFARAVAVLVQKLPFSQVYVKSLRTRLKRMEKMSTRWEKGDMGSS